MIGLIMAGGSGTRFWPLSRAQSPKQFLRLFNDKSMIQLTFDRLNHFIQAEDIYVVTTLEQKSLVIEHLDLIPKENIIIEPFGMNTAPCVGLSVHYLLRKYPPETNLLIVPSDQLIHDDQAFRSSVVKASTLSEIGKHVVFGIVPNYPATGYGYIEQGELIQDGMFHVKQFKEKPDYPTAVSFLESGRFLWNCGMFLWKLETIVSSYETYYAEGNALLKQISDMEFSMNLWDEITAIYRRMPKIPVDIAIMEKVDSGAVIPLNVGWNDVGSWYSLHEVMDKDTNNNKFFGDNLSINAHNNFVYSKKTISLVDVDNLIVVETEDAILIMPKDSSEKVKNVVDLIKERNRLDLL